MEPHLEEERRSDVDDHGAGGLQLQQEVLSLCAQVTAHSGLSDAVRAINNLATAQVRESYRRQRSGTPEGILWTRGGCPAVVKED